MISFLRFLLCSLLFMVSQSFAFDLKETHASLQFGGFWSDMGQAQFIPIEGLIGDDFSVTKRSGNGLVGLAYLTEGPSFNKMNLSFGVNIFYLANATVKGDVYQERMFKNLSYRYHVSNLPIYAAAKGSIPIKENRYAITLDAGIGPNVMKIGGFEETPLDNITLPDNIFASHTSTVLSATAGVGFKVNQVFGRAASLECGYRFFYLGQGRLAVANSQVGSALMTGQNYANAMVCGVSA